MELLTEEETTEIKKLYRNIVKSLYPDLNPRTSEAENRSLLMRQKRISEEMQELCSSYFI